MNTDTETDALRRDLRAAVAGAVRFDPGHRALYATDASNYRRVPLGVVFPLSADDVEAALAVCRRHGVPVLPRGAGTSLAGQACNVAVVLDLSRHLRSVVEVDPDARTARVQPGAVLDDLRAAAAPYGLTFGPDPATHDRCTLGGMIGNNACGVHSLTTGTTADNVVALDVVTYDGLRLQVGRTSDAELDRLVRAGGATGALYAGLRALREATAGLVRERYPRIPRRVSGYNLDRLLPEHGCDVAAALVGTEGTCATVLEAQVRLVPVPERTVLVVLGYPDVVAAAADTPAVLAHGPTGLEAVDDLPAAVPAYRGRLMSQTGLLPAGAAWLLVELAGPDAADQARRLVAATNRPARVVGERAEARAVWSLREAALGAAARPADGRASWPGWEDSAVAPDRLAGYLRDLRALIARHGYLAAFYGHFGEGCVHCRIDFDFATPAGVARFRAFTEAAADLVVSYGGSLSGEHGDGQARGELLRRMYGAELVAAFREYKRLWDPAGRMNPGAVVDPRPLDADLRLGPGWAPRPVRLPGGPAFAQETTRCVGVGACRKEHAGTMCPSWMVTRDERHSTRGRAHLLFELLSDGPAYGLAETDVHEALDLCLACKACAAECPTGVDLATWKAGFLARYHERHRRSLPDALAARVDVLARLGARAPAAANAAAALLPRAAKRGLGLAPRPLPRLAGHRLHDWWRDRPVPRRGGPPVVLFADTFTTYFQPGRGQAAAVLLEHLGAQVTLSPRRLCCGRPRYEAGLLDDGRDRLRATVAALSAYDGPVVVLEPSCAAMFRDDAARLLPDDPAVAAVAARVRTLGEHLDTALPELPARAGRAVVHPHCHERAVLDPGAGARVLARLGVEPDVLDSGCCGLAGGFGFARSRHDVSVALAERVLAPAVRRAGPETLVVTDGFSCAEQVAWRTGRRPDHLAEAVARLLGLRWV